MPVRRRTYAILRTRHEEQAERAIRAEQARDESVAAAARVARRYNALAAVVAVHVVTAEDHDVDIHPAALRKALVRAGIDLSIEFNRAARRDGDPS
jgi:hypothetical protein